MKIDLRGGKDMENANITGTENVTKLKRALPITKNEDTEFSLDIADEDDFEAREKASEADDRQQNE